MGIRIIMKYKIITLCGSTKFKEQFQYWNKYFTLNGNVVISVGCFGHSGDSQAFLFGMKCMLDQMHLQKIDMADQIFVINKNDYIGQSTKKQIEYAKNKIRLLHI